MKCGIAVDLVVAMIDKGERWTDYNIEQLQSMKRNVKEFLNAHEYSNVTDTINQSNRRLC